MNESYKPPHSLQVSVSSSSLEEEEHSIDDPETSLRTEDSKESAPNVSSSL